ncbi:MAG: phosphatase PAP2 family protein [Candidatus Omnitrophota bacterium]|nr:phosphatase PAP2 family protein [Candidatus Omnitrophota bacterium]
MVNFHFVEFFDIPVFNFINHNLSNHFLNYVMPIISRMGGGELYFALGVLLLFSRKRELKILGIALLAGITVSYYIVTVLKVFIARPRPFVALANVIFLGPTERGYSFPSNHTTMAFMTVSLLASHFKKYILFYSFAALVAFSRVYMGVHYPIDVLSSAILGCFIGWPLVRISRLLETKV